MPSDLYAERLKLTTGSLNQYQWTISAFSGTNPNGVASEPSGSLCRSSDGGIWINTDGSTGWIKLGAATQTFSYTATGNEGTQASVSLPTAYPSSDYKVFITNIAGSAVSAYQIPEDLRGNSSFKVNSSAPFTLGDKFDFLTVSGTVYGGTPANAEGSFMGASVWQTGSQTVVNNSTGTLLFYGTEEYDTDGFFDAGGDYTRLTAPESGYYLISVRSAFSFNATGFRQLIIRKNANGDSSGGVTVAANKKMTVTSTNQSTYVETSAITFLTASDYVQVFASQNSGATLTLGSSQFLHFQIAKIAPPQVVISEGGSSAATTGSIFIYDVSPGGDIDMRQSGTVDWLVPQDTLVNDSGDWYGKKGGGWLQSSFRWIVAGGLVSDSRSWNIWSDQADNSRLWASGTMATMYGYSRNNGTDHGYTFRIPCDTVYRRVIMQGTQFDDTIACSASFSHNGVGDAQVLTSTTANAAGKDYRFAIDFVGPRGTELIVSVTVSSVVGGSGTAHIYCHAIACWEP